jgi:hypothetical protein
MGVERELMDSYRQTDKTFDIIFHHVEDQPRGNMVEK